MCPGIGKKRSHQSLTTTLSRSYGSADGHKKDKISFVVTHPCQCTNPQREVEEEECDRLFSNALNCFTICQKSNCIPPWKRVGDGDGDGDGDGHSASTRQFIETEICKAERKKKAEKGKNKTGPTSPVTKDLVFDDDDPETEDGEFSSETDELSGAEETEITEDDIPDDIADDLSSDFDKPEDEEAEDSDDSIPPDSEADVPEAPVDDSETEKDSAPEIEDQIKDEDLEPEETEDSVDSIPSEDDVSDIPREDTKAEEEPSPRGLREVISPILEGNVPSILVSNLFPDPDQPRQSFDEERIEELGRSILEHGQMLPIIVLVEAERNVILEGERRWRACQKKRIRNIYAIVVKDLKIDKFLLSAICNFGREGHTHIDTARAVSKAISIIERMAKKDGKILKRETIIKKVADGFCKSTAWVYQYLSISRLDPKVQDLLRKGELPLVVAADISKVDEPAEQIKLAKEVKNMSANSARQFVRRKIESGGLSSITKKREWSPKDDFKKLKSFVYRTNDTANIILDWGPKKIIGLFFNRLSKDKTDALDFLDRIILRLQKIRNTIYNENSSQNDVKPSVKELWGDFEEEE